MVSGIALILHVQHAFYTYIYAQTALFTIHETTFNYELDM